MRASEVFNRIPTLETHGTLETEISGIVFDSRKVTAGALYIAVEGVVTDGHAFIANAVDRGASVVVCEIFPEQLKENITYIKVKNTAKTLGQLASDRKSTLLNSS